MKLPTNSQLIIYQTEDGQTKIDVRFDGDTVWLTQTALAELFQTTKNNISQHVKNVFEEGEVDQRATVKKFLTVQTEGQREVKRELEYYNLDLIISIGYRIKSRVASAFRIWATKHLHEFIVKGFVMDDERLKNPDLPFDYFEELTRRISEIRTSEKRFYRKITDIYATSVDYDPTNENSILFFKTVQNKVHYAITGSTAAEIIAGRVDSKKPNVGLINFRGSKPTKEEIVIAKNYLSEQELLVLNNLVEQYLVFAEGQAMQRVPMYMKDWIDKLHGFLQINNKDILKDAGKVSHELAKELAEKEFDKYYKKSLKAPSKADVDFETFANKAAKLVGKGKKKK
ncbi:hydroxyacid dehydrogenase [Candidatus Roizmanbacteria bacterium CG2_30_33_16]|uniref:Hydroxyacid dehydrogenase n=4 Tax=Candidatus Roizmaniibacteriota TaxID=1752723 RepID=A0A2M7LQ04_9BACT|nr:virulence RhuM family protein [Candidatus Roizmanbacteria bacterium]OIP86411.1 MAG: hydroxyacid dehydrogenase [Candidatus Roizmanbacteria bacterium CG2_30_33_16]PIX70132.1 MAG: hydroxyacid dehydrogenase [Candidatus Roizmanbacteria bacterium CG_4_10_14_3_um_filter_33_21]PJB88930.1 MAG: hydroxyacid dehydrogenase [Candidatus Roizmanbacteria bacterium CG_4_9_14_0_8_um_filter_34_12]